MDGAISYLRGCGCGEMDLGQLFYLSVVAVMSMGTITSVLKCCLLNKHYDRRSSSTATGDSATSNYFLYDAKFIYACMSSTDPAVGSMPCLFL